MSVSAILQATRDMLQTVFGVDANSCEVGFDGKPKPSCGQKYFAIHSATEQAFQQDWDLSEEWNLAVTITLRMGFAPEDRWGIAVFLAAQGGMAPLARKVKTAIHHNQLLRIAACNYLQGIGGPNANQGDGSGEGGGLIVTPLQWLRNEPLKLQDYNWFGAEPPTDPRKTAASGVSQTLIFGKCQRCQDIPQME